MPHFSEEEHLVTIHYFIADTEGTMLRLMDYMEYHEAKRLLGKNELQLLHELTIAFRKYNNKELSYDTITTSI